MTIWRLFATVEAWPRTTRRLENPLLPPDFQAFRLRFDAAVRGASADRLESLRAIGASAFEAFLSAAELPDQHLLRWFVDQCNAGSITTTETILFGLRKLDRTARRAAERLRHSGIAPVLQTQRVVQLSWFGVAGFQSSDAFEVRQSIFRSPQEREFCAAARLRFPGLAILPNYPLRCFVDLDKLAHALPDEVVRYGYSCDVDVLLATPREGDAVAVFELDSRLHDEADARKRDSWRNSLISTAHIPLYRLRSENPTATTVDEWYSVLTDQVMDKIDCGRRIRSRDIHTTLVPISR